MEDGCYVDEGGGDGGGCFGGGGGGSSGGGGGDLGQPVVVAHTRATMGRENTNISCRGAGREAYLRARGQLQIGRNRWNSGRGRAATVAVSAAGLGVKNSLTGLRRPETAPCSRGATERKLVFFISFMYARIYIFIFFGKRGM